MDVRRKQAELLVWNSVPWTAISQIGVIDATMAQRVGRALAGAKGPRGWGDPIDIRKAEGPAHPGYGRCVFVGREKGGGFRQLRSDGTRLQPYAAFEPAQLRWAD